MKIPVLVLLVSVITFSCNNKKENGSVIEKTPARTTDTINPIKQDVSINAYAPVDISPMDMCYFPADYPILKMSNKTTAPPVARVVYSRPHLQGRTLFKDILKYGEPWRLGANEATEIDLYTDATIQGKKIKAGRYVLYCIPEQDKWTIVLNSNIDSWGLHPDASKDIARFVIPSTQTQNTIEFFTIIFQKTATGADLLMAWDNVEARLPVSF